MCERAICCYFIHGTSPQLRIMAWTSFRYSLYAPFYDLLAWPLGAARRRAVTQAGIRPGDHVLIVGCGTGLDLAHPALLPRHGHRPVGAHAGKHAPPRPRTRPRCHAAKNGCRKARFPERKRRDRIRCRPAAPGCGCRSRRQGLRA